MARCGVDSRRKCEELIALGQVEVNGEVVREPGVKIDPARDRVVVAGKRLRLEQPAYYIHYKVKGVTTTVSDDLGRKTVMDCLPGIRERVYPVGRLDKDSEGLLVLTNDGELANYLTHPAHGVGKTYRVVAEGRIEGDVIRQLAEKGMRLGPVLVKPSRVELVRYDNDNTVVLISVSEGINREVRRIFAALGHEVKKLLRIQVGPLSLEGMKRGATRPLMPKEVAHLKKGMDSAGDVAEGEMFPAGSAKGRRPTGPRGRPRRTPAPRHGKPDPALARTGGKGSVVTDDWEKTVKTGRGFRAKTVAAKPERPASGRGGARSSRPDKPGIPGKPGKPGKPLRPTKRDDAKPSSPAARAAKKPFRPARPKAVGHPLTGRPPVKGGRRNLGT